ncbi:uncharacterized protein LOC130668319 [Microplitis mediator]|uniref:uncharacterized protein LOC130668319 n=1 Tax=Microplitis mediator TaxID=375433 RepID=UPI0025524D01|nr:uncharacterized protein LOC130668319 [Microplitis mediator]
MPHLEISCDCKSYCLTKDMHLPGDIKILCELMEDSLEGIEEDEDQIELEEEKLEQNVGNASDILESMKKHMKTKALSQYIISLIINKYERCSYIHEILNSKNTNLGKKYMRLKGEYSHIINEVLTSSTEQLKKKFIEYC